MRRVVVHTEGEGGLFALLEDDRLIDLRDARGGGLGAALWCGRVTAIDRHLNAAFVDLGLDEPAFLAAKDARCLKEERQRRPVHKLVHEGQVLVVQGLREAGAGKGPRVTADVVLDAPALRLHPHRDRPEAGPRARGRLRDELTERAERLFSGQGVGLRPQAEGFDDEELVAQAESLSALWRTLRTKAARPGRLGEAAPAFDREVWSLLEEGVGEIAASNEGLLVRLKRLAEALPETSRPQIVRLEGDAFTTTEVADELARARSRVVPLKGGGRIVIEPTAACVAIDVDGSGRTALEANLEAAGEIGLQARLRNLGGTLVVDFVDMPTRPQRQRLEEGLRRAFRGDPLPVQIYPMSPLGIVQISRARRGAPLAPLSRTCPTCEGAGVVENDERASP